VAQRLAEFARACKAATRIVALYPSTHPSIQAALARIVDAGTQATSHGPFIITVLPGDLLVGGRAMAKPDSSIGELAVLLHQHLVGELTVAGALDRQAWHTFLSLLAKTPEEVRGLGGISRAWMASGGGPIELREIDYQQVLRERNANAVSAEWDEIITNCLQGDERSDLDEKTLASLLEIASDPARLTEFLERLQERARAEGDKSNRHKKSLLQMMHGLVNYAARKAPEDLDRVLSNMAGAAARLTPEMLLALITDPPPAAPQPDAGVPMVDLGGELQSHMTDEMMGRFVADNVVRDRGATARLAEAFHTLVPDAARRRIVLAQAEMKASQTPLGQEPQFENIWSSSLEMLMQYSDADFVSADYARELSAARSQAVDVERASDDPPERVSAWLDTVTTEEVRTLDQQLILDLLRIEDREDAWIGVLDVAVSRVEQLVLVGDLRLAHQLLEGISALAASASPFAAGAAAGLKRLSSGPLVKHLVLFMRQATDQEVELAGQFCQRIGPAVIAPLAEALSTEDNSRTVRRLRDVLIGFGPAARAHANELRNSRSPAVRRAAVELLRALAGEEALPDLRSLLDDADPQVQRDALRAIVQIGTAEAYASLENALETGAARTRDTIMQAMGALRDERAAPLFVYILKHTEYKGPLEAVYTTAIEALGRVASDGDSATALKDVLYRGEFFAPGRTRRLRAAAARALRAAAAPDAEAILTEAAAEGPRGVRAAAKAALASPRPRPVDRSERIERKAL
jgi:hypothetical protein